jgi:hypothetical protein
MSGQVQRLIERRRHFLKRKWTGCCGRNNAGNNADER